MFTLTTNAKFDELERLIDKISRPGAGETRKIADGIRQEFQRNFTTQSSGFGRWAGLAQSTVTQRRQLGYSGERPVLVRSGGYRASFVQRGGDNHESIQTTGFGLVIDVGSNDRRAIFHERGTRNMPQRSVTMLTDDSENRLARIVDFVVEQIERREWK